MQRLLHEGAAHGGLSSFQRETIERVMHLGQVRLGSVMVPRGRAALVPEDISRDDFLRIARMAHFSRYPVYRGDPRQVIGVVEVFDVITDGQRRAVARQVRPPLTLRADQRVPAALRSLQREPRAMAIIVDRRGQCVGLLTMKDLVEEIVGDLAAW